MTGRELNDHCNPLTAELPAGDYNTYNRAKPEIYFGQNSACSASVHHAVLEPGTPHNFPPIRDESSASRGAALCNAYDGVASWELISGSESHPHGKSNGIIRHGMAEMPPARYSGLSQRLFGLSRLRQKSQPSQKPTNEQPRAGSQERSSRQSVSPPKCSLGYSRLALERLPHWFSEGEV